VVYRVRKCYIPRNKVGDVLRVVLGVNFSVIRTKIKVECKVIKSVLSV